RRGSSPRRPRHSDGTEDEAASARTLSGELACGVGRYPPYRRQVQLPGPAVTTAFAVVRALHFASLMAVFGASALLFQAQVIMTGGKRLRLALLAASLTALATAVLWLCFTAADMSGGALFDPSIIATVVTKTTFGAVFVVRFALLVLL